MPMPARKGKKGSGSSPQQPRRALAAKGSDREMCPRCGRATARIIGRSESFPVLYLRCDDCQHTSVAPA
jgi:hypothetical protein